jgi:hypothetical protein
MLTIGAVVAAPEYGMFVAIGSILAACVVGFIASRRGGAGPRTDPPVAMTAL